VESAIRYLQGRDGGAAWELKDAVSGIR